MTAPSPAGARAPASPDDRSHVAESPPASPVRRTEPPARSTDLTASPVRPTRPSWRVPIPAALALALAWALGLDLVHAAVIGLLVAVMVTVGSTLDLHRDATWERERPLGRDGARHEVATLSWTMLGRDGRVGERMLTRLRRAAAVRLARVGLDVADPADAVAITELLGRRAAAVLVEDRHGPLPRLADVEALVARLETLVPAGVHPADPLGPRRTTA